MIIQYTPSQRLALRKERGGNPRGSATKRDFMSATKKARGFREWFCEPLDDNEDDYAIEILVSEGYTIGDNEQTGDRVHVYLEEMTKGEGWYDAIQALKTIESK